MFAGLYTFSRFIKQRKRSKRFPIWQRQVFGLTAVAVLFRGIIMSFVDYGVIFHILLPLVLGINRPEAAIAGLIPIFVLYNVTTALYTIPTAYLVAVKVGKYMKIEPTFL